jgi:hypothetical protein
MREEPAAVILNGGVCEGRTSVGPAGTKRVPSRKRRNEAKKSLQPTEYPQPGDGLRDFETALPLVNDNKVAEVNKVPDAP